MKTHFVWECLYRVSFILVCLCLDVFIYDISGVVCVRVNSVTVPLSTVWCSQACVCMFVHVGGGEGGCWVPLCLCVWECVGWWLKFWHSGCFMAGFRKKLTHTRIAARSKKYILIKNELGAPPCGWKFHYVLDLNNTALIICHVTSIVQIPLLSIVISFTESPELLVLTLRHFFLAFFVFNTSNSITKLTDHSWHNSSLVSAVLLSLGAWNTIPAWRYRQSLHTNSDSSRNILHSWSNADALVKRTAQWEEALPQTKGMWSGRQYCIC